jgi:hypothetical protein
MGMLPDLGWDEIGIDHDNVSALACHADASAFGGEKDRIAAVPSIITPGVRAISTWQVSPSGSRKLTFGKVQSSTLMAGSRSQAVQ